ncbi:ubiquitin carboxyl-terminal hydrolase MINDY-1 isoform X2 [Prinia subflava]|uniref:ubiquitin carboxyl-terminal hydrolase MINDY-1 isoform X2 n=1 Tax=Prinia subflava TaxID=208062 RepID=UPI002FE3E65B
MEQDGTPGGGDRTPGVGDRTPGGGARTPGGQDGTPGVEDGTPGVEDGTPGVEDGTPGGQDGTPGGGDRTPRGGDRTPGVEDRTPGVEDRTPGGGAGTPGVEDGTPRGQDGTPGGGDGTPGVEDGTPRGQDGTPGVEDGTPGVGDETPAPAGGAAEGGSGPEGPPGGSPEERPRQRGGSPAAGPPRAQPPAPKEEFHRVKWIGWKGQRTPVVTQSENGPCPLLAIINILLLQWKVKLPPQKEVITAEELMAHLGDCILATQPRDTSEGLQLNFQQNISDTMMVLPKLSTGLDVNVRFTGVSDFEYTPECIIFDLLNIPLYHGWLVDPQSPEQVQAVGRLSYNQLVEKIITCKQASDSSLVSEGLVAEQFLESSASQLTFHGLCELTARAREGELGVFFRNNHFSTIIKHKEERVVWESLHSVDGDSSFCDSDFHLSHGPGTAGATAAAPDHRQSQVDQDFLMALSLQEGQIVPSVLSDLELARQLQHEEYQQHHPHPQPAPPLPAQAGGRAPRERRQRQRPDLDCALL